MWAKSSISIVTVLQLSSDLGRFNVGPVAGSGGDSCQDLATLAWGGGWTMWRDTAQEGEDDKDSSVCPSLSLSLSLTVFTFMWLGEKSESKRQ